VCDGRQPEDGAGSKGPAPDPLNPHVIVDVFREFLVEETRLIQDMEEQGLDFTCSVDCAGCDCICHEPTD